MGVSTGRMGPGRMSRGETAPCCAGQADSNLLSLAALPNTMIITQKFSILHHVSIPHAEQNINVAYGGVHGC